MANPRRKRSRNRRRSRRSNPSVRRHSTRVRRYRHHGRRGQNPAIAGFSTNELLNLSLGASVGVIGSKYIAQLALGANNTGMTGYAASAVSTIALAWAAHKFVGKDAATGVLAGGLGALVTRIWQDNVSGTMDGGMSGLGDPDMARLGLGEWRAGSIAMPSAFAAPMPVIAPTTARRRG